MAKHISFGKIADLYSMVKNIANVTRFKGVDENGQSIYSTEALPTLKVAATVKMHGSNASISEQNGKILYQSRNNIVSNGHFGFPEMMIQENECVKKLITDIKAISDIKDGEILTVFGEIIGPGVQKTVALNKLKQKYWVIFAAKITNEEGIGRWVPNINTIKIESERIKNVYDFGFTDFDIDFNNPKLIQNIIIEEALRVEEECPVAKGLEGVSGIGEGIVLEVFYKGHRFTCKVKGDKHAKGSKIKKMAQLDPVVLDSILKFTDHAATEARVMQAVHEVSQKITDRDLQKRDIKDILKFISNDIIIEEADVLKENNLEYKQVAKDVSNRVRQIYFKFLEEF